MSLIKMSIVSSQKKLRWVLLEYCQHLNNSKSFIYRGIRPLGTIIIVLKLFLKTIIYKACNQMVNKFRSWLTSNMHLLIVCGRKTFSIINYICINVIFSPFNFISPIPSTLSYCNHTRRAMVQTLLSNNSLIGLKPN